MALREQLLAVAEELRRRKADGDKTVSIGDETLASLRDLVARKTAGSAPAIPAEPPRAPSALTEASVPKPEMARHEIADAAANAPTEPKAPPAATASRGTGLSAEAAPAKSALKVSTAPADAALPPAPKFDLPAGDKATRWAWLKDFVENHPICRARVRPGKKVVLGVGSLDAKIFFCGEAPGAEEEVQGEPFVGPAGQLLTKMIKAMGLERSQVYIGNILNWRPEMATPPGLEQIGNRPPTAEEMAFCLPFWRAQLEIVQPEIIVALGATAASGLLGAGSFKTLGEIRGQWQTFAGRPVMVTYHPSYLLRNNSNRAKRTVWEDLLKVMERAQLPISDKQRSFFLER
ncbi:MAG TPA: uracil-DNA glycosylase family protein [Opitutaceae bacterium]|nr:uracil-DNA glycosylase family protein [Opitutaceae bacterium]